VVSVAPELFGEELAPEDVDEALFADADADAVVVDAIAVEAVVVWVPMEPS
jgi:hypothetical protein